MISGSNVAALCGLRNKDEYVRCVISILRGGTGQASRIAQAVRYCFGLKV